MQTSSVSVQAVGIAGSLSAPSRSGALVGEVLRALEAHGASTTLIELSALPADALLARSRNEWVETALTKAAAASILILGTPIYRASYTGQLKAFFDLFPRDALAGTVVGLIATGAGPGHALAVDHGLRPLVASLRGLSAAQAIYATDADLGGYPTEPLPEVVAQQVQALADELLTLASARQPVAAQ
jgi:FMN reductase